MIVPLSLDLKTVQLIELFREEANKTRRKPMSRSEAVRYLIANGLEWYEDMKQKYHIKTIEEFK